MTVAILLNSYLCCKTMISSSSIYRYCTILAFYAKARWRTAFLSCQYTQACSGHSLCTFSTPPKWHQRNIYIAESVLIGDVVLESDMDVLHGHLQVVDDSHDQLWKVPLIFSFWFLGFLCEIVDNALAVALNLLLALLDDLGVLTVPFWLRDLCDDDLKAFQKDLNFAARKRLPRNVEFDESDSAEFDEKGQVELLHDISFDDEISEDNLSRPDTYFEVLLAEIFNILAHDLSE